MSRGAPSGDVEFHVQQNQPDSWMSNSEKQEKALGWERKVHMSALWTVTDAGVRGVGRPFQDISQASLSLSYPSEKLKELPITQLPVSAGIMAAILIGSLASGSLFIGCVAHLLLTRGWRGQSHRYRGPRPLSPSLCPLPHPLGPTH